MSDQQAEQIKSEPAVNQLTVGSFGMIKTPIKLMEVYDARDKGYDVGDLDGLAKLIAVDNTEAYRVAFHMWESRLKAIDVGWSEWCGIADDDPGFMVEAASQLRRWLVVFFPAIQAIHQEFAEAMAKTAPSE